MVNKGYSTKKKKKSGSKVSHAPNSASQQLPKPELRPSGLCKSQPQTTECVRGAGDGPQPAPAPGGGRAAAPSANPFPPAADPVPPAADPVPPAAPPCAPAPRGPGAPRPRPRHTPAPGPRGQVTRRASPTRAPHWHTPAPWARRAPRRYLHRGSGSRPVRAGGPGPFVPSSSEWDEGLGGERGMGDWRQDWNHSRGRPATRPAPQPEPGSRPRRARRGRGPGRRPREGGGGDARPATAPPPLGRAPASPPPRAAGTAESSPAAPAGPPPLPPCALRCRPQRRGAPTSGRLARRSLAAGWELLLRRRGRAVDPPPTPGREPRRFAGAAPGLAPCRPLIGAPGRPLGREARRPSAALGAYGRTEEGKKEAERPGKAGARAGLTESRATTSPPPFPSAAPPSRPDRRRVQPISARGARGVSRASGASNRKGDVARWLVPPPP